MQKKVLLSEAILFVVCGHSTPDPFHLFSDPVKQQRIRETGISPRTVDAAVCSLLASTSFCLRCCEVNRLIKWAAATASLVKSKAASRATQHLTTQNKTYSKQSKNIHHNRSVWEKL